MRILSITAGAAGMYCGSCGRDNALAVELIGRGHDVTLLPIYTPTRTDEENVSRPEVLFGGISVYLAQHLALFRHTPRLLDRLWDSPRVIRALAGRSVSTDPKLLGSMTISMLEGDRGVLRKEFVKLTDWLSGEPVPDIVNLPNSLLLGLARPIGDALKRPVCCTLQGEDLFLDGLVEPYRSRALALLREKAKEVDAFIAVSDFYAPVMARMLGVPESRISVVPLGISLKGYEPRTVPEPGTTPGPTRRAALATRERAGDAAPFRVGYFARIAPEKGLHVLAEAYRGFRARTGSGPARLEVAGYLSHTNARYLEEVRYALGQAGLASEFSYHGEVDRDGKLRFLRSLDALSVPATYDEPKGVFLLEAMASGVPVVQPRRGAFTEIVERTGGGVLVEPDNPAALAEGLYALWHDRALAARLGRAGADGVGRHYTIAHAADRLLAVYSSLINHEDAKDTMKPGLAFVSS